MLVVNPIKNSSVMGSFDFQRDYAAPDCLRNVDPGGIHPHLEHWYGPFGNPQLQQGVPCLVEKNGGTGDPTVAPWIDLVIEETSPAILYHTGRLSGSMIPDIADKEHKFDIKAWAIPVLGGNAVSIGTKTGSLQPSSAAGPNLWYWYSANELLYSLKLDFTPSDIGMSQGIYTLLVDWTFTHDREGFGTHCEPFCGFDDNLQFKVTG